VIVGGGDGLLDVVFLRPFLVASAAPARHLACRRRPRRARGLDAAPALVTPFDGNQPIRNHELQRRPCVGPPK
jgi:hypothetical protein